MTYTVPEILAATREHWRLDTPVPLPRGDWMRCPVCRASKAVPKEYVFFCKDATIPWRADATFKCGGCAFIWTHGIAFEESDWERFALPRDPGSDRRRYDRPEIRELLKDV